jgi:hypothetical protein
MGQIGKPNELAMAAAAAAAVAAAMVVAAVVAMAAVVAVVAAMAAMAARGAHILGIELCRSDMHHQVAMPSPGVWFLIPPFITHLAHLLLHQLHTRLGARTIRICVPLSFRVAKTQ